jgi:DNA polymerase elongation subunit (family B)
MRYNEFLYENVFQGEYGKVYARLYNPNNGEIVTIEPRENIVPDIYEPTREKTEFTSYLDGSYLVKRSFSSRSEMNNYINDFENSFILHGYKNASHHFIRTNWSDSIKCNHKFHLIYIDIETRSKDSFPDVRLADQEITTIQMYDTKDDKYIIFGLKDFTGDFELDNVVYKKFSTEERMLETFLEFINIRNPSGFVGFNSMTFDFPYITNRMITLGLDYERLSPIKQVKTNIKCETKDGMEGITSIWTGYYLFDYRELFLEFAYANLPSISLHSASKFCNLEGKVDHSEYASFDGFYTGKDYIFPEKPPTDKDDLEIYNAQVNYRDNPTDENWKIVEQLTFNKFIAYGIKDVQLMVQMEEVKKLIETVKYIAYICGVSADEVYGTLVQWRAFVFNECYSNNIILPLKQHFAEDDVVYKGGWTRAVPNRYDWVLSYDYTSLFPSIFRTFNIGTDTMVKSFELPPELKELKEKYFYFFTPENIKGLDKKLGEDWNDSQEELDYYKFLIEHKSEIEPVLKKHNVIATPNGYFFRKNKQSVSSVLMERIFNERLEAKRKAQELFGKLESVDKDSPDYTPTKEEAIYQELKSQTFKIFINSFYGAGSLKTNPFSSGKLTNACVTISARMVNMLAGYELSNTINSLAGISKQTSMNQVKQGDTDSVYVSVQDIMSKGNIKELPFNKKIGFISKLDSKYLQPTIHRTTESLADIFNFKDEMFLEMEQEIVCDRFVSIALKRYFGRILVKDGTKLKSPKMKITGISLKGKNTPVKIKHKLEPVLDMILDKDYNYVQNFINEAKQEFYKLSVIDIARRTSVSSLYYTRDPIDKKFKVRVIKQGDKETRDLNIRDSNGKNVKILTAPIGSTAGLLLNEKISSNKNFSIKYNLAINGDKILYIYVKAPNPLTGNLNVMGFKDANFVKEIDLDSYLDKDTHFEKDFVNQIRNITDHIGWDITMPPEELDEW